MMTSRMRARRTGEEMGKRAGKTIKVGTGMEGNRKG